MILNRIGLTALSVLSILVISPTALADTLTNSGSGGYYNQATGRSYSYEYEVWRNDAGDRHTLKVWNSQHYPNGSLRSKETFTSAREALDHFDCYYASKEDICESIVTRLRTSLKSTSPAAQEARILQEYCSLTSGDIDIAESIDPYLSANGERFRLESSEDGWTHPYGWDNSRLPLDGCH